jgi:hypothetical protein
MSLSSWVTEKLDGANAVICSRDLKSHLQWTDVTDRAMVLIIAENLAHDFMSDDESIRPLLLEPLTAPEYVARKYFRDLSDALFTTQRQNDDLIRAMKCRGERLPAYATEQFARARTALQVWCSTVTLGFSKAPLSDVRYIWKMLSASRSQLQVAWARLKDIEEKTARDTGAFGDSMFNGLTLERAAVMCAFVPNLGNASSPVTNRLAQHGRRLRISPTWQ